MMDDDIKKAEKRGYARGYAAGKQFRLRGMQAERTLREEQAFWDRAYLVLLPFAFEQQGWKFGDQAITKPQDRTKLAAEWATTALQTRRLRRP
ncbi:hypothetical protein [Achromobacter aloeverae]|uniref:Uncharacterized protein n=1 Tax=Achromobacter aloeverae TaxID=1750518 RepID=A0A4Q1HK19_9BURK|nr:hypothetical protein [Achromobacter aloeverae]RXN87976.1 hypothetical protein C7R54_15475 [Achromobacter aloeverae]